MKNKLLSIFIFLGSFTIYSQVGIGTPMPNASSQLEITASNRGVLIPRISLTSSTDTSTITSGNVNSLLVFNTATVSDIKAGYYYWFDNKWNRIVVSGETAVPAGSVIYNSVTQTFSYIDNSGNSQVIDFSSIVKANETVTNQIQNKTTGAITYTNEAGNSTISQVVSANAGNLLKVGTDGGAMLDVAAIPVNPTTVSNASTGNIATVTVNGQTSTGAPIVNLNETSLSGTSLTTTVNGVASTALDLSPILASGTTNTLGLAGNTLTSNVNGVSSTSNAVSGVSNASTGNTATVTVNGITSSGAPIVNLNETSLSGTSLTTTVNGVSSTALDLAPAISASQTVTDLVQAPATGIITYTNESGIDQTANVTSTNAGNILTVGTDGGSLLTPTALTTATSVSNTSTGNTATVTVNGKTSIGAPIVNLNETSLSGTSLTTTVNGVASLPLDLAPAISASQTVTDLVQAPATGIITYTNESGTNQTANVTSTNAGNILTVGTDGGSLLTSTSFSDATSVSNSSTGNTATVTVNGKTSTGAPIVNLNETSLSGTSLTTTVNGVSSTALDLAPAISASQTVTDLVQVPSTGVITYTNESGTDQTANVTSTNAGNILTVGTDGGSLLTPTALTTATSVSNASTGNTATVTVNGITSSGAPIVNLNQTSLSGTSLTTTVNGVSSTALDLTPAILASQTVTDLVQTAGTGVITYTNESGINQTANVISTNAGNILTVGTDGGSLLTPAALTTATSVSNASTGNTATITVNGKTSTGAPIVNLNETSLSGTSLTTTVNGVSSTALDLAPAISASQTVTDLVQAPSTGVITYTNESGIDQTANVTSTNAGNILTVGTDGGSLLTSTSFSDATSVSNSSTGNTATVTVNGKTSTGAPIVNLNETSLSGASLTTTVNGVASTALDLAPAISASQTVTDLVQAPSTGVITYTNESGIDQTANVTSTNAGNILTVGTDGGSLLTSTSFSDATSVSNSSTGNTATVTVNGKTSTGAPIVNTNILTAANGNLVSTVNGIATTPSVPVLVSANNGLTATNGNVELGGTLAQPTTIATNGTNTLAISGLQTVTTPTTDNFVTVDGSGNLHQRTVADAVGTIGWLISGNTGTTASNFLGTISNQPLLFRINNTPSGMITTSNTTLGYQALSTGSFESTAIGVGALAVGSGGGDNTAVGFNALNRLTSTVGNTAVGALALNKFLGSAAGGWNTAVGYLTLAGPAGAATSTGAYNSALGSTALNVNTTGSNNVASGYGALAVNTTGSNNTALGTNALAIATIGNYNVAIGTNTGIGTLVGLTTGSNNILIGGASGININASTQTVSNEMNIGNTLFGTGVNNTIGSGRIGINNNAPTNTLHITATSDPIRAEGLQTGATTDNFVVVNATGVLKTIAPNAANYWRMTGNGGTDSTVNFLGTTDGQSLMFKINNVKAGILSQLGATGFGLRALSNSIGTNNTAFGHNTLTSSSSGTGNVAVGYRALEGNTGNFNTALGVGTLLNNTSGNQNIAIGNSALGLLASGTGNIALGYQSGTNVISGSQNIIIGNTIDLPLTTGSNRLNIGNAIFGTGVNNLGSSAKISKIGINIDTPTNTLHVSPQAIGSDDPVRIEGLKAGSTTTDNLVVANAAGVLKIVSPFYAALGPWHIQNTSDKSTSNTDAIYQTGKVAIGTSDMFGGTADPNTWLAVNGSIQTALNIYPDYVFENYFNKTNSLNANYSFKTLNEIEKFIKENKHLPGVTGIKELSKNERGDYIFNISKLSVEVLEKVEELYLHIIEQQKQLDAKDKEIQKLRETASEMDLRIARLEKLVEKMSGKE